MLQITYETGDKAGQYKKALQGIQAGWVSSDFQLLHGFTHSGALVAPDGQVVQSFTNLCPTCQN